MFNRIQPGPFHRICRLGTRFWSKINGFFQKTAHISSKISPDLLFLPYSILAPRPYLPRSMLASRLHHPHIIVAQKLLRLLLRIPLYMRKTGKFTLHQSHQIRSPCPCLEAKEERRKSEEGAKKGQKTQLLTINRTPYKKN